MKLLTFTAELQMPGAVVPVMFDGRQLILGGTSGLSVDGARAIVDLLEAGPQYTNITVSPEAVQAAGKVAAATKAPPPAAKTQPPAKAPALKSVPKDEQNLGPASMSVVPKVEVKEVYDAVTKQHRPLQSGEPTCSGKAKDYAKAMGDNVPCFRAVQPGALDEQSRPSCDFHAKNTSGSVEVQPAAIKATETAQGAPAGADGQGRPQLDPKTSGGAVSGDQNTASKVAPDSPSPASSTSSDGAGPGYEVPEHVRGAQMLRDVVGWLTEAQPKGRGVLKNATALLPELEKLKASVSCVRQVRDLPKRLERVLAIFASEQEASSVATA